MDDHGGCMGGLRTLSMGIQNFKSQKKEEKVLTKPVFEPKTFQRMLIRSSQRHSRMIMSIFGLASIQCRPEFRAVSYNLKILTIYLGIHLHTHAYYTWARPMVVSGVQLHLLATYDMENNDPRIAEHGQTHQQISISNY
jgi:hypothetical protein